MSRVATLIGSKGGKWSSLAVGTANEIRIEFKKKKFQGFDRILYLDSSGVTRRKRGGGPAPKPKPKKAEG